MLSRVQYIKGPLLLLFSSFDTHLTPPPIDPRRPTHADKNTDNMNPNRVAAGYK